MQEWRWACLSSCLSHMTQQPANETTVDNAYSSQPAAAPLSPTQAPIITIRVLETPLMVERPAIITADTSAAGHAPARDWERDGVGDGTGAAPTIAPLQAPTAAPRADPTSQKAREAAGDVGHPVDRGAAATATAGAAATGHGPAPEQLQPEDERTQAAATTPPPHDH